MKILSPKALMAILLLTTLSSALLSVTPAMAADTECVVTVSNTKGAEISQLIFGSQEEIYVLPYVKQNHFSMYKQNGISMLRYPCGTPSDHLLWNNVEKGYWGAYAKKRHKTTPDGFLSLCKNTGFEPLLTVNTNFYDSNPDNNGGTTRIHPLNIESIRKGANYAAQWVNYQNIKKGDAVKYWEIGNEVWIWMHAEEYAKYLIEYSKAMRKIDPSIKIIACGLSGIPGRKTGPFNPKWLDSLKGEPKWTPRRNHTTDTMTWSTILLDNATGHFDYLAPHIYFNPEHMDPIKNGLEGFSQIHENLKLSNQVELIKKANYPVRLAVTEWCINFRWLPEHKKYFVKKRKHNAWHLTQEEHDRLTYKTSPTWMFSTALCSADFLGKMISCGYVDIAINHTLCDSLGSSYSRPDKKQFNKPIISPNGLALKFWQEFAGDVTTEVKIKAPMMQFEGKKFPALSAYATIKGDKTFLILINRNPDKPLKIKINTDKKTTGKVIQHMIKTESWSTNFWRTPGVDEEVPAYTRTDKSLPTSVLDNYNLQPSSLICLEF